MSRETNVGKSVLDLGDIIKAELITEIAKSRSEGRLEIKESDFRFLVTLLKNSIDSTVRRGVDGVLRNLK